MNLCPRSLMWHCIYCSLLLCAVTTCFAVNYKWTQYHQLAIKRLESQQSSETALMRYWASLSWSRSLKLIEKEQEESKHLLNELVKYELIDVVLGTSMVFCREHRFNDERSNAKIEEAITYANEAFDLLGLEKVEEVRDFMVESVETENATDDDDAFPQLFSTSSYEYACFSEFLNLVFTTP